MDLNEAMEILLGGGVIRKKPKNGNIFFIKRTAVGMYQTATRFENGKTINGEIMDETMFKIFFRWYFDWEEWTDADR